MCLSSATHTTAEAGLVMERFDIDPDFLERSITKRFVLAALEHSHFLGSTKLRFQQFQSRDT